MATANVVVTRTGTGWTVDVTACNLDPDLTVKDFYILHNGSAYTPYLVDYAKTTQTVLTYTGASLGSSTTVEVRRKTPTSVVQTVSYASRVSSSLWNKEFDRVQRRAEEYELNGVGAAFSGVIPTPQDTAYGVVWDGDTVYPPTRNAVYDKIQTMAPLASPSLTGTPTAPTAVKADNTTQVATTAHVKLVVADYAPLANPTLTGTPAAPTATDTTDTTQIATTEFVKNTTSEPYFLARRTSTDQSITGSTNNILIFNTEDYDSNSAYNNSTGVFTVPTGKGGLYLIGVNVVLNYNSTGATTNIAYLVAISNSTPTELQRLAEIRVDFGSTSVNVNRSVSGTTLMYLNAGDTVTAVANPSMDGLNQAHKLVQSSRFYGYRIRPL